MIYRGVQDAVGEVIRSLLADSSLAGTDALPNGPKYIGFPFLESDHVSSANDNGELLRLKVQCTLVRPCHFEDDEEVVVEMGADRY